jgi:flagellar biogenesis protein FliO
MKRLLLKILAVIILATWELERMQRQTRTAKSCA